MSITAADVNKLRQMTGAGLMDCKKALTETSGDFDAAVDLLRAKGAKISAKRADRDASEGAIIAATNSNGTAGVIVQLNCETDFVGKNEGFVGLATKLATMALENKAANLETLLALDFDGITVQTRIDEEMAKIGEKIQIGNYTMLEGENIVSYIHGANRLGVLVSLSEPVSDALTAIGKDLAMQIAAMNPIAIDESEVSQEVIDRELAVGREQALAEGKPEAMVDKIAQGKLGKFFKENTLLKQDFVKDGSKTVEQMLKEVNPNLKVKAFNRFQLGA